jgi:tol-pal system protein YbgF
MISSTGFRSRGGALALALALAGSLAHAQQAPPGPQPAAKDAAPAGLQRRVEQIEEQLVDLQVMIGTLESLARGTAPPPPRAPAPAAPLSATDIGRLDAIETQITALAAQMERLQEQVRGLAERVSKAPPSGFGAVTVAPAAPKDDLDRVFPPPKDEPRAEPPPRAGPPPRSEPPPQVAVPHKPPAGPAESGPEPQRLYEQAYGYLLQKDYGAAEQSFEDFLKRHPNHQLAGNAQYWLGETFFVRGQYRPAAAAFLKGYKEHASSQKAPETLLKLAMSLQRLGQKDAACSSYSELAAKFPNPPAHVRSLALTERKRGGC